MNRSTQEFAEKLYEILEDPSNQRIIRWNDDGESFLLIDSLEFTKTTLEQYFKHKNLNSFIRQLNKYDFHKVKSNDDVIRRYGEGVWEFKHSLFKRKRKDLLNKITRKKSVVERKEEFSDLNVDVAEKSIFLQNQMLNSLKQLSAHFQALTQDIIELKRAIFGEKCASYTFSALVFEESERFKQSIVSLLQKNGFTPYTVDSVDELNSSLHERKLDLFIISSTIRNYLSILVNVKKANPNILIVLTGNSFEKNELIEIQRIGVDDILLKPFNDNSLCKIIRKLTKGSDYANENIEKHDYFIN